MLMIGRVRKREGKDCVMDALRIWIISLVSITIICTVIEKLAPEGSLGRYVKLACGLVITIVIAGPAIKFITGDFNIENISWKDYMSVSENEMKSRITRLQKEESGQLLEIYRRSLVSDIKTRFSGEKGFSITDVDAVVQEDYKSNDYGAVREIYIKVGPPPGSSNLIFVAETEAMVKNKISQTFGVDSSRIIVDSGMLGGG